MSLVTKNLRLGLLFGAGGEADENHVPETKQLAQTKTVS